MRRPRRMQSLFSSASRAQPPPDALDSCADGVELRRVRNAHEPLAKRAEGNARNDQYRRVGGERLREDDGVAGRHRDEGVKRTGGRRDGYLELACDREKCGLTLLAELSADALEPGPVPGGVGQDRFSQRLRES